MHALNSEHAQSDLWLPAVGYWLYWFGLDQYCVGVIGLGRVQFKPSGVKRNSVPYVMKKSRVIYSYQCGDIACGEEYIGETSRTWAERYKEHLKQLSPIYVHIQQTGHIPTTNNFNIHREGGPGPGQDLQEAIYIRVNNPTLNRNMVNTTSITYWTEFFLTTLA